MQSNKDNRTDQNITDNQRPQKQEFNNTVRILMVLAFPASVILKKVFLLGVSPFQVLYPQLTWLNVISVFLAGIYASLGLSIIFNEEKPDNKSKGYKFYKFLTNPIIVTAFLSFMTFTPGYALIILGASTALLAVLGKFLSMNM